MTPTAASGPLALTSRTGRGYGTGLSPQNDDIGMGCPSLLVVEPAAQFAVGEDLEADLAVSRNADVGASDSDLDAEGDAKAETWRDAVARSWSSSPGTTYLYGEA